MGRVKPHHQSLDEVSGDSPHHPTYVVRNISITPFLDPQSLWRPLVWLCGGVVYTISFVFYGESLLCLCDVLLFLRILKGKLVMLARFTAFPSYFGWKTVYARTAPSRGELVEFTFRGVSLPLLG